MANPSALTVTSLTANASATQPAGDTIDTNGTVPAALGSQFDRVLIEVVNAAAAALTVAILAGDNPPAQQAGQGNLSVALAASGSAGDKKVIGPFESGRFAQDNGDLNVSFTAASGSPNATVRVYKLPRI